MPDLSRLTFGGWLLTIVFGYLCWLLVLASIHEAAKAWRSGILAAEREANKEDEEEATPA